MKRLPFLILLLVLAIIPCFAQETHHPESPAAHAGDIASDGNAHANEGHGTLGGEHVTLWKSANFVIFVGLIVYFLRGKMGPFFAENNRAIAQGMAHAAAKAEEAQVRLNAMEQKLAAIGNEIAGLREHAATEMERDRERIERETAEEIQRLQERAESEIHSAAAQARARLRHQAAVLALDMAERQVKAETASPDMQNRLLAQALERLSHSDKATRN